MTELYKKTWNILTYTHGNSGGRVRFTRDKIEKRLGEISLMKYGDGEDSVYLLPHAETSVVVSSIPDNTKLRIRSSRNVKAGGKGLEEELVSILKDFKAK